MSDHLVGTGVVVLLQLQLGCWRVIGAVKFSVLRCLEHHFRNCVCASIVLMNRCECFTQTESQCLGESTNSIEGELIFCLALTIDNRDPLVGSLTGSTLAVTWHSALISSVLIHGGSCTLTPLLDSIKCILEGAEKCKIGIVDTMSSRAEISNKGFIRISTGDLRWVGESLVIDVLVRSIAIFAFKVDNELISQVGSLLR